MNRRKIALAVTLGVAAFAAANSFTHIYALARDYGQDELSAALLPFTVDGLILVGSLNLGRRKLAHVALWGGVAATMAGNVAGGLAYGAIGAIISTWPAGAFLLCAEIAIRKGAPESAPKSASAPRPRTEPRAVARAIVSAPGVLDELRREAAAGVLPSKRTVKARMGVGWDKAVQVHGELAALVPA